MVSFIKKLVVNVSIKNISGRKCPTTQKTVGEIVRGENFRDSILVRYMHV